MKAKDMIFTAPFFLGGIITIPFSKPAGWALILIGWIIMMFQIKSGRSKKDGA